MAPITRPAIRPFVTLANIALLTMLSFAGSAHAVLADSIQVKLFAPDFTATPYAQAAPLATGILAGNLGGTGDISTNMVDDERISFSGDSIHIRVGSASSDGFTTGWGAGAKYELSGLSVQNMLITGVTVSAFDGYLNTGFTGLASPSPGALVNLGGTSSLRVLSFTLDDTLQFVDRGMGSAYNYAEFRIALITQEMPPVPEPGTLVLMVLGGLGLLAHQQRKASRGG